jgi:carbon-monoxide dehydrogenase large subunit
VRPRPSAKVTGAATYASDVRRSTALWGGILRSPVAHARIIVLDVERARQLPGVHAVLTGRDLPEGRLAGRSLADVPLLCRDVVRFIGDRVAAVAAETREQAEAALKLIEVSYAELPAVFSPEEALAADAPTLHPDFLAYHGAPPAAYWHPNVCAHEVLTRGDVVSGFAQAEVVLEHEYSTPPQHQGYLEPHSALLEWRLGSNTGNAAAAGGGKESGVDAGIVRVWASNKAPFLLRDELARILDLPPERIVVEPVSIGGDFGGKGTAMEIPLAAHLARVSGRPVRIVLSGVEELSAANPRHAARVWVRTGLCHDGRLVARSVRVEFDGGAYAGYKPIPGVNLAGRYWSVGPYRIPHVRFESTVVYTNNPPAGHMRAPGEAQLIFATEVDIDRCAEAVGMDPLEFRELNAVADGEPGPLDEAWRSVGLRDCLQVVRLRTNWEQRRSIRFRDVVRDARGSEPCSSGAPRSEPSGNGSSSKRLPDVPEDYGGRVAVGRGVAVSHCAGGLGASSARVELRSDDRAVLRTGASDQGSGAYAVLAEIVSRELHIPAESVEVVVAATDVAPFDSGSSASRVTYVAGTAAQRAAAEVRLALTELAAELLGCTSADIEFEPNVAFDRARPEARLPLTFVASRGIRPDQPLVGEARFADFHLADTPSFAALVAEVEVDRQTGAIGVRRLSGAYDVGTVLNETGVLGQIQGGLMQGLGFALMEEVRRVDGRVESTSLAEYKLPTGADLPPHDLALITNRSGDGPFGAKAVGELSNPLAPAAIANAVHDAVGIWICELPLSAERVYQALHSE